MTNKNEWQEAKEVESNWFKFNQVGDKVKGTLINKSFLKTNDPVYPDQWRYELKQEDGSIVNVGISIKKAGTIQRLNSCALGEIIGILFESEGEAPKKGFNKIKNLKVYTFGMDGSYQVSEALGGKEVNVDEVPFD